MGDRAVVAERGAEHRGERQGAAVPVRLAAVFLPAPLPREGRIAFWDPEGAPLPPESPDADATGPEHTELTVVRPHGAGIRRRT
ncbi:hypothetical protein, partial [Streptomyces sp. NRRL WC-3774]